LKLFQIQAIPALNHQAFWNVSNASGRTANSARLVRHKSRNHAFWSDAVLALISFEGLSKHACYLYAGGVRVKPPIISPTTKLTDSRQRWDATDQAPPSGIEAGS